MENINKISDFDELELKTERQTPPPPPPYNFFRGLNQGIRKRSLAGYVFLVNKHTRKPIKLLEIKSNMWLYIFRLLTDTVGTVSIMLIIKTNKKLSIYQYVILFSQHL